ncbi:MAG: DUF434 domain-containing protein [Pirellulaceae bacterium]
MPDRRRHRGPHPEDEMLFARSKWPDIQMATSHLSWLLSRDYAITSAVKLVGDRFGLDARQRIAVQRSACSDGALERRAGHQARSKDLAGSQVDIDGFNILTTVEAGLAGGVLLRGRDGCLRDMASMHGSYRRVEETVPALEIIGETLEPLRPSGCTWWLDRPVSNSGRLSELIQEVASRRDWPWRTQLSPDPDPHLSGSSHMVITADSVILDRTSSWFNLAALIFLHGDLSAWVVPVGGGD